MKLTRTTIVVPLAGLLLVGAAGAALAATADPSGTSAGVVAGAPSASPSATDGTTLPAGHPDRDGLLAEVLDGLVADGTITDSQRTAILDGLTTAREQRFAEAKDRAEQLRTFLEDGVISQEEFDQLPEDSRLRQLTTLMDDGQITSDELDALRGPFGGRGGPGGHGFRGFHGFGGFGGDRLDEVPAPSASPTTSG